MSARVTRGGVRLASAAPRTTPSGQEVARVGIWPPDGAPMVLTVDEIALALAYAGDPLNKYTLFVDEAAEQAVRGVRALGRGQLSMMAERLRDAGETEVWPEGWNACRSMTDASELCRKTNRDRTAA